MSVGRVNRKWKVFQINLKGDNMSVFIACFFCQVVNVQVQVFSTIVLKDIKVQMILNIC